MSAHLERARLYLETGRAEKAAEEVYGHLAEEPHDGLGHAILAICLLRQEKWREAQEAAEQAVHLAPDSALPLRALGIVRLARNDEKGAVAAARSAIEMDPQDEDLWVLLARCRFVQDRFEESLEAADRALAIEPGKPSAMAMRSLALAQLGHSDEANETAAQALRAGPESDLAHVAGSVAALHAGRPVEARAHALEALRLDPTNEAAKSILVLAIKAANPAYRVVLTFFLWMSRLGGRWRWALIIGFFVLNRVLRGAARADPDLEVIATPVTILYATLVVVTWLAEPLTNLLLRLHPEGRHALSQDQLRTSNWVGGLVASALAGAGLAVATGNPGFVAGAVVCSFGLLLPVGTYHCEPGWPRKAAAAYSYGIGAMAILGCVLIGSAPETSSWQHVGIALAALSLLGMIIASWGMQILGAFTPKKR